MPDTDNRQHVTLVTADGLTLEARWDLPDQPVMKLVFCHPHPKQGGTMMAPLMHKVTGRLVERGISVLRFNFRGVGKSQGVQSDGELEINDVQAAVDAAQPDAIAGWSFGAATALRWLAATKTTLPYGGIAPASDYLPAAEELPQSPKLIIVGDREQVVDRPALETYAATIGAHLELLSGSDHFFYFREEVVADKLADFFMATAKRA